MPSSPALPVDLLSEHAVPHDVVERFQQHFALLLRWNKVHNLTRVTQPREAVLKHYLDSWLGVLETERLLTGTTSDPNQSAAKVYDIGAGAGFPGIACALRWTKADIHWVEPSSKRVSFLQRIKQELQLDNVVVQQGRLQDIELHHGDSENGNTGNLLVSRATFPWEDWLNHLVGHYGSSAALWCGKDPTQAQWESLVAGVAESTSLPYESKRGEVKLQGAEHRQILVASLSAK